MEVEYRSQSKSTDTLDNGEVILLVRAELKGREDMPQPRAWCYTSNQQSMLLFDSLFVLFSNWPLQQAGAGVIE